MSKRLDDLIQELRKGGEETVAFFQALDEEELGIKVYTDDRVWTVKDMLAHFVTIERSMHILFDNILMGGEGSPDSFDIDYFNRRQVEKLKDEIFENLIGNLEATRKETIRIVHGMQDTDLDRTGKHPVRGYDRLEIFLRWAAEHAKLHQQDIKNALANAKDSAG